MQSSSSLSSVVCRQFSLDEIEDATNNFDHVLGEGGEGKVYRGHIAVGMDEEKCLVAVKRFNRKRNSIEFEKEIEIVSKIRHPNLVSLLGYCDESDQKILVYEYMESGSLSDYVKTKKISNCLSWKQRLKICLDVARGLQYLHTATDELTKGIIHRDVKPANILLDKNWVAKVSDFGMFKLSRPGQTNSSMSTDLKGTNGYYAPEYIKFGRITRKIDVYAFGVVLFEVLCRKMPWDRVESYYISEDDDFGAWAQENVDVEINGEISGDSLKIFADIIRRSMQQDPGRRPTMDEVVLDLERALKCHEDPRISVGCNAVVSGQFRECIGVWPTKCFRCHACNLQISDYKFSMSENHPFHISCYKERYQSHDVGKTTAKYVVVGPWGGPGGDSSWSYTPEGVISHITLTYSSAIESITFTSKDDDGNFHTQQFGNQNCTDKIEIEIDTESETLTGFFGTYGMYWRDIVVTSLSFSTSKRNSIGPFGSEKGETFKLFKEDGVFDGFHGRSGRWLDSIGASFKHEKSIVVGPWGGSGGDSWIHKAEGVISHITITYDKAIHSIIFTSKDREGNLHVSDKFGSDDGHYKQEITIDTEKETLNGIRGTYDIFEYDTEIVTSLSFSSNIRNVIGPFGYPTGKRFSLPIKGGVITGFHGRSGLWLDSIGVHLKPI